MPEHDRSLRRTLTLPLLTFYGIGTILGLGIYILLGEIAADAGMLSAFAFLFAAILAGFTGLSYGELSARIPKSAGEVNWVDEAFDWQPLSTAVGWLIVVSAIVSTATVMNGYVGYVDVFVQLPDWLVVAGMTLLLSGIAAWGISQSAAAITGITIVEILGLVVVIAISGHNLSALPERWPELLPSFTVTDWEAVGIGAFLAFFAFIGFEDMVNVAEEAKNPRRDMPVAILIALGVMTVLYVVVAVIASLALPTEKLAASDAPLADVLAKEGEHYPLIISAIGLVAVVNGVLVQIVMSARVLYGMAEKSMAPAIFGRVSPVTRTPLWSTVFTGGLVLALALFFELGDLARATNFILIAVFVLVNLSLWAIKRRRPAPEGVRTWPLAVPVAGAVLSVGILALQVWTTFRDAGATAGH